MATKWLVKEGMITTTRTTRGIVIKVLNYDKFQDPKNYENDCDNHTRTTRELQTTDTINKNDKNEKNIYKDGSKFKFADGTVGIMRWGEWVDVVNHAKLGYEYLKQLK